VDDNNSSDCGFAMIADYKYDDDDRCSGGGWWKMTVDENEDGGEQQQWQQYLRQWWKSVDSDGIRDDNGGSGRQGMQPQKLDKQWDRPSMTKRG